MPATSGHPSPAFGIGVGETVRLNVVNLADPELPPNPCELQLAFMDSEGNEMGSALVALAPGQSGFLDLPFANTQLESSRPGRGPIARRRQVRAIWRAVAGGRTTSCGAANLVSTVELFGPDGKTMALYGQQPSSTPSTPGELELTFIVNGEVGTAAAPLIRGAVVLNFGAINAETGDRSLVSGSFVSELGGSIVPITTGKLTDEGNGWKTFSFDPSNPNSSDHGYWGRFVESGDRVLGAGVRWSGTASKVHDDGHVRSLAP